MRKSRHHNNTGYRQIKNGKCDAQVRAIVKRMGKLINLENRKVNELGYSHVVCLECEGNLFHVKTEETATGNYNFKWLVCNKCESHIPVNIQPVWGPK